MVTFGDIRWIVEVNQLGFESGSPSIIVPSGDIFASGFVEVWSHRCISSPYFNDSSWAGRSDAQLSIKRSSRTNWRTCWEFSINFYAMGTSNFLCACIQNIRTQWEIFFLVHIIRVLKQICEILKLWIGFNENDLQWVNYVCEYVYCLLYW